MRFKIKDIFKMAAAPFVVFMVSNYFDRFTAIYRTLEWPNRLAHFSGGVAICVPIYIILKWAKANKFISTSSKYFDFLLLTMAAICIASFWEFYEFTVDKFFPGQFVAQPSVNDTMKDMMMGFAGALVFVLAWHIWTSFKQQSVAEIEEK